MVTGRRSRRAGFTVIEVLIALGVLASLLLISMRVGTSSSSAYRQATTLAPNLAILYT